MRVATAKNRRPHSQPRFQSTPPVRVATPFSAHKSVNLSQFQSTPPVRVATFGTAVFCGVDGISIHATRAGGDDPRVVVDLCVVISIHATRAGGDAPAEAGGAAAEEKFQSTPPVRVATHLFYLLSANNTDFNPRHPCGWRLSRAVYRNEGRKISIHATRAGGDTIHHYCMVVRENISIHATRAGGDAESARVSRTATISIHATRAGGDLRQVLLRLKKKISIHATRAGGDGRFMKRWRIRNYFNPRHPCGWRQQKYTKSTALSL